MTTLTFVSTSVKQVIYMLQLQYSCIYYFYYFYLYKSITYSTSWNLGHFYQSLLLLSKPYFPPHTSQGRVHSHEAKVGSKVIESLSSNVNEPERQCAKHGGKCGCMHHATHTRSYLVFSLCNNACLCEINFENQHFMELFYFQSDMWPCIRTCTGITCIWKCITVAS